MSESDDFEIEGFRDEIKRLRERLAEVREIQQRTEGNATELHIAMYEWIRKEDKP